MRLGAWAAAGPWHAVLDLPPSGMTVVLISTTSTGQESVHLIAAPPPRPGW